MSTRKLTEEDVRLIRKLDDERVEAYLKYRSLTRLEIAKKFDVSYSTVTSLCSRESYKEVR